MTLYLASKLNKRTELVKIAEQLTAHGHEVVATWLDGSHDGPLVNAEGWAMQDLIDITICDQFVMFNLPVDDPESSSGRYVELGYALALQKPCTVVGNGDSVFYSQVTRYPTVEAFLDVWKGHTMSIQTDSAKQRNVRQDGRQAP